MAIVDGSDERRHIIINVNDIVLIEHAENCTGIYLRCPYQLSEYDEPLHIIVVENSFEEIETKLNKASLMI